MSRAGRAMHSMRLAMPAQPLQIVRHSHIGARPIPLPRDVTCSWHQVPGSPASQSMLRFTGPKGVREVSLPEGISPAFQLSNQEGHRRQKADGRTAKPTVDTSDVTTLVIECQNAESASQRSNWGLIAATAAKCVQGVSSGSSVDLHLVGVGYRASIEQVEPTANASGSAQQQQSQVLVLRLGYPRPIRVAFPSQMQCEVSSPTEIKFTGNDKAALAQLAAKIRALRPPEPYNGKGVFVGKETIQRKEVKKK